MGKCQWSKNGRCECFVIRYGTVHPECDGIHHVPCSQGKLDLVDIRDAGPLNQPYTADELDELRERIARAPAPVEDPPARQGESHPGRGGRRAGAGAPKGNLNAIKSGAFSKQLKDTMVREKSILARARAARERRTGKL